MIDKAVEILGDGQASEIILQNKNTSLEFLATMGRIAGLTLRQFVGDGLSRNELWLRKLRGEEMRSDLGNVIDVARGRRCIHRGPIRIRLPWNCVPVHIQLDNKLQS